MQKYLDYIVEDNKATAAATAATSFANSSPEMMTNSNLEFDYGIDSVDDESVEDSSQADEQQQTHGLKRNRDESEDNESELEQKKLKPLEDDDFDFADLNKIDLTELVPLDECKIEEIINYLKIDLQQTQQIHTPAGNLDCEDLDLENFAPFLEDFSFNNESQHSQTVDTSFSPMPTKSESHFTPNNSPYYYNHYYNSTEYYSPSYGSQSPMNGGYLSV